MALSLGLANCRNLLRGTGSTTSPQPGAWRAFVGEWLGNPTVSWGPRVTRFDISIAMLTWHQPYKLNSSHLTSLPSLKTNLPKSYLDLFGRVYVNLGDSDSSNCGEADPQWSMPEIGCGSKSKARWGPQMGGPNRVSWLSVLVRNAEPAGSWTNPRFAYLHSFPTNTMWLPVRIWSRFPLNMGKFMEFSRNIQNIQPFLHPFAIAFP